MCREFRPTTALSLSGALAGGPSADLPRAPPMRHSFTAFGPAAQRTPAPSPASAAPAPAALARHWPSTAGGCAQRAPGHRPGAGGHAHVVVCAASASQSESDFQTRLAVRLCATRTWDGVSSVSIHARTHAFAAAVIRTTRTRRSPPHSPLRTNPCLPRSSAPSWRRCELETRAGATAFPRLFLAAGRLRLSALPPPWRPPLRRRSACLRRLQPCWLKAPASRWPPAPPPPPRSTPAPPSSSWQA